VRRLVCHYESNDVYYDVYYTAVSIEKVDKPDCEARNYNSVNDIDSTKESRGTAEFMESSNCLFQAGTAVVD
jgi:hypothetical protein